MDKNLNQLCVRLAVVRLTVIIIDVHTSADMQKLRQRSLPKVYVGFPASTEYIYVCPFLQILCEWPQKPMLFVINQVINNSLLLFVAMDCT